MLPITNALVQSTLSESLVTAGLDIEVFTDFPSDATTVSEGVYVTRFYQDNRTKKDLALGGPGSVYDVVDRIEMYLIQGQGSPLVDSILNAIGDFVDNEVFISYYIREYTVEQLYRKNNESYRIIFSLTRLHIL